MEDISMRGAVVRISQDSMEAYLTLQPPEAGEGYTLSELVRYIRTQRVTNGIDEAAIQEMIDAIAPRLLPVLFTGLIFYLIKVKKWTTYKLVILTIILGVVLSVLHLIA